MWIRAKIHRTSWTTDIDQTLLQCCFSKNIDTGQVFITLDEEGLDDMKNFMSRVHLTPKWGNTPRERVDSQNTKIGSVLDVKVSSHHQRRYGVEITIESLSRDQTVSWVRAVNGINKYVTETPEEILVASVENRSTWKFVAKAKPRPKPTLTLSPVSIFIVNENG